MAKGVIIEKFLSSTGGVLKVSEVEAGDVVGLHKGANVFITTSLTSFIEGDAAYGTVTSTKHGSYKMSNPVKCTKKRKKGKDVVTKGQIVIKNPDKIKVIGSSGYKNATDNSNYGLGEVVVYSGPEPVITGPASDPCS